MEFDVWWDLVNVAVWALTFGYVEGQLVGTGEFGGMGCNGRLWRGHLVGTGECCGVVCIELVCRWTVGGYC